MIHFYPSHKSLQQLLSSQNTPASTSLNRGNYVNRINFVTSHSTRFTAMSYELIYSGRFNRVNSITDDRPTYGYRLITAVLRKSLKQPINPKRTYRIMKKHCLLLQKHGKRPVRVHDGKIITLKSNLRRYSDHFSIQCWNGD